MPKIAVVNSNNTSFTVTDGLFKQTYPLVDSSTNLVNNVDGSQTLYLLWGDEVVVVIESTLNTPFAGNSIFGATTPLAAQTVIQTAIGAAGSGGGGGGGTSITQAEVKAAIESATNLDQLETLLDNLGTYTGGLEGLQLTGNVSLTSIDAKLTALIDRIQNPGRGYSSTAIGSRAANTTTYAANDVYGNILEFTDIGPAGGVISLNNLQAIFNLSALPVNMGSFRVYLYNAPPASNVADNAPFSIPAIDRVSVLNPSAIIFGATSAIGGGSVIGAITGINTQVKLAPGSTSLWAYLVTGTAFTPAAISETFKLTLSTLGT